MSRRSYSLERRDDRHRREDRDDHDRKMAKYRQVVRELLSSPDGREFYWHLISKYGLYSNSFSGNSREYYTTGKRHVALELSQLAESSDFDLYTQMRKENHRRFLDG